MSQADQSFEWYLARDGQQHGPISAAEMSKIIELGYLLPTDLVWRHGLADWQPASTAFPPKAAPEQPPPPPAPPPSASTPAGSRGSTPTPTADDKSRPGAKPGRDREPAVAKAADPREIIAMEAARREESARRARDGVQPGGPRQPMSLNQPQAPRAEPRPADPMGASPAARRPDPVTPTEWTRPAEGGSPRGHVEPPIEQEWEEDETPRRRFPRLAIASFLLLALLSVGGYGLHATGHLDGLLARLSFSSNPESTATPVVTAKPSQRLPTPIGFSANPAQVDQLFQQAALWQLLKTEFPDWYQERVRDAARLKGEGKTDTEVAQHLAEQLVTLRRRHVSDALAASPQNLKTVASSFLENLERLSKHSIEACYGFISQGETNPLIVELTRASEHTPSLQRQASAIFTAIAEGRRTPARHRPPTREDYDQLATQLAKRGWSPADLQLFSDARSLARAAPDRVCKMVQDWFAAQLAVGDEEVQVRLLIEALKPVVAG